MKTLEEMKATRYTKAELDNFIDEVINKKNRNPQYLLNNLQAFRLLGWQIKTNPRLHQEYMLEYWDVLKYDTQLSNRSMRLYIPPKAKEEYID